MEDLAPNRSALDLPLVWPEQQSGQLAVVQAVIRVPGAAQLAGAAPRVSEHNDALLAEAGFSDAQLAKLRGRRVTAPV
jgi:crotonobetainyl-CoA:carnitine CoA-transferase CaiB-like acyl-CoA transferase